MKETVLTICSSVITGVVLLIITEIINTVFVKPLSEYKVLKGEIVNALTYYSNLYSNVCFNDDNSKEILDVYRKASDDVRKIAAKMRGFAESTYTIQPFVPSKVSLINTSKCLIRISNCFIAYSPECIYRYIEQNDKDVKEIYRLLEIENI